MNIFQARFGTGTVLEVTGVTNASLQTWLRRGVIIGQGDEEVETPGGPGRYRSYSYRSVIQIALAKAMIDLGIPLATAFKAAGHFAHGSNMSGDKITRVAGLPFFGKAMTLIWISGEDVQVCFWTGKTLLRDVLAGGHGGVFVLIVEPIFDEIIMRLGFDLNQIQLYIATRVE